MSKLTDLIAAAQREVGTCEIPMGSNIVKYNDEYWGTSYRQNPQDYPWCVVFLWSICRLVGVPFPKTAHCNGVEQYARENKRWTTGPYIAGDMVIFDYDKDGSRDHIGLVIEASGDTITTVEGNCGDKVARVQRRAYEFIGAYRPDYGEEQPAPEPEPIEPDTDIDALCSLFPMCEMGSVGKHVGALESLLRLRGYKMANSFVTITQPDEEFGPECLQALQDYCGADKTTPEVWAALLRGDRNV